MNLHVVWLVGIGLTGAGPALDGLTAQLRQAERLLGEAQAELACWTEVERQWQEARANPDARARQFLANRRALSVGCPLSPREELLLVPFVTESDPALRSALAAVGTVELKLIVKDAGPSAPVVASFKGALAARLTALGLTVVEPATGAKHWRIQQALVASNQGSMMGTRMLSLRVGGNLQLIDPQGGVVLSVENSSAQGHINEDAGFSKAAAKVGDDAATRVLEALMVQLAREVRP